MSEKRVSCLDKSLHLLSAPARIGISHVGWWLNRWNEFQSGICETRAHNQSSDNVAESTVLQDQATSKEIDCPHVSRWLPMISIALTKAAAEEREQEARVFGKVGWDLRK